MDTCRRFLQLSNTQKTTPKNVIIFTTNLHYYYETKKIILHTNAHKNLGTLHQNNNKRHKKPLL